MGILDSMFAQYGSGLLNFQPPGELQTDPWTGYRVVPDQPQGSMAGRVRPRMSGEPQMNSLGNPEFSLFGNLQAAPYDPVTERWARTLPPDNMGNALTGLMQGYGAAMPGFDPSAVRSAMPMSGAPQPSPLPAAPQPTAPQGAPAMSPGIRPGQFAGGLPMPPQEEALPPGATTTQGNQAQATQPMPQAQEPGFLERISAASRNFGAAPGLPGLFDAIQGMQTGGRTDPAGIAQSNQTNMARALYGALQQRGIPPAQAFAIAQAAATDPKMAEKLLPQALGLNPPTTIEGVIAGDMYKNPGQGGGSALSTGLAALEKLEAAKARGTNVGKVEGETKATAQANLPGTLADVEQSMETIRALRNHKGRNSFGWHGVSASIPAETLRGGEAFGAIKLEDRLKARVFTEQVKTMVGMGALSNAEGAKITDAVASLDRGLKKPEYDKTLDFIESALRNGIDKMAQKAGHEPPNAFRGSAVKPGVYDWSPQGGMKARGAQ